MSESAHFVVIDGLQNLRCWNSAIISMARIGEYVSFEVTPHKMVLAGFNASESVLATMDFQRQFFKTFKVPSSGSFSGISSSSGGRDSKRYKYGGFSTRFQIQSKILVSIFRRVDKENNTAQRCIVAFESGKGESDEVYSQNTNTTAIEVDITLQNGMTKVFRTPCMEAGPIYHGGIDQKAVQSWFKCDSRVIKTCLNHVSPRTEEMGFHFDEQNVTLTAFTRAIMSDKEILKQPLQTQVSISLSQFDSMDMRLGTEISFRYKEFATVAALADGFASPGSGASLLGSSGVFLHGQISHPGHPMMFEITGPLIPNGVNLRFMFMTNVEGDDDGGSEMEVQRVVKTSSKADVVTIRNIVTQLPKTTVFAAPNTAGHELDDEEVPATVTWDESAHLNEPSTAVEIDMSTDEEDEEFEKEILALSQKLDMEAAAIGPTQGASQAKGLFD